MSQPESDSEENVISLQNINRNFLTALQRQHDMLAFTLAGIRSADPKAYEYFSSVSRVMPAPSVHLPHDQMVAYSRGLLLRTSMNDLLALSSECLNQCHLLCLLIKTRGRNTASTPDNDRVVGEKHAEFARMNLQDKFNAMEETFDIISDLEDSVFSIAAALRVLVRGGLVTNDDISPDGSLTLEFKAMKEIDGPAVEPSATGVTKNSGVPAKTTKLADSHRTFKPGEVLELTDEELLGLNITVAKFFDGLFRSIDAYGREQLGGKA